MTDDLPTADLTRFLAKLPVFKQLKSSERGQLLTRCRLLALDHRKILQASGEPHHHLWVVVTGEIAMVASSAEGDDLTLAILDPAVRRVGLRCSTIPPQSAILLVRPAATS